MINAGFFNLKSMVLTHTRKNKLIKLNNTRTFHTGYRYHMLNSIIMVISFSFFLFFLVKNKSCLQFHIFIPFRFCLLFNFKTEHILNIHVVPIQTILLLHSTLHITNLLTRQIYVYWIPEAAINFLIWFVLHEPLMNFKRYCRTRC